MIGRSHSLGADDLPRKGRSALRIVTSFPPTKVVRPVPLRHAGLFRPAKTSTGGDFAAAQRAKDNALRASIHVQVPRTAVRRNREVAVMSVKVDEGDENFARRFSDIDSELYSDGTCASYSSLQVGVDEVDHERRPKAARGHRRRLSDKFRTLMTFGRRDSSSFSDLTHTSTTSQNDNEDPNWLAPPGRILIIPARPYRSPGTASFLVSRHSDATDGVSKDDDSHTGNSPDHTVQYRDFRVTTRSTGSDSTSRASVHTFGSGWKFPIHAAITSKGSESGGDSGDESDDTAVIHGVTCRAIRKASL